MGLLRWVSNRLGFKSAMWFLIGGGCGGRCWLWFDGVRMAMCGSLCWFSVFFFFFFFYGYDRCLKGLWVVVGSGVWVVFG